MRKNKKINFIRIGLIIVFVFLLYLILFLSGHLDLFYQILIKCGVRIGCSQVFRSTFFGLFFMLNLWLCGFLPEFCDLIQHFGRSGSAEAEDHRRGENRNSDSDPAEQRNVASSSHGFPYREDEVIGGDSVNAIKSRLLAKIPSPSFHEAEQARVDAEDRFELKVGIIRAMTPLHPEGDWEGRGARALDNNRTATGEESVENLARMKEDLDRNGIESGTFRSLRSKVFLRREDLDANSES